ncbi:MULTISPECIES: hypothetical protein [unclassified Novosphingobium]|uniref:hypothetical protein n=1 Tax=unclassified Novosphingobium TaxID=2644732 RepID=UPI000D326AF2|nr:MULTISPECIES: hypothetical protein [unclassified Novosphingobium]PTR06863.1 hypothetical protein C8K11_11834 [Novosphingobium sp. GV055]PUA95141.1 hypothetical protein C8K12_11834 [Novosphingobium sp. GV061]PUB14384.1 hypothetical protein C8K14_11834 [Novosphingobium sp. GV079]PUB38732.1 hypothetical protein C8K10_11834 [Novosphingobium sp. GV027]
MIPLHNPFWPCWLISLAATCTITIARLGLRLSPAGRHELVWRECLALPVFPTVAACYAGLHQWPPAAAALLAMALALPGYPRLARAMARYILRK